MLSGGECSYVTLVSRMEILNGFWTFTISVPTHQRQCLLLAMAESVEMPFRICDEFDVYMDAVARTTAFYLIVAAAEEHKHRQIICITCKDLGFDFACKIFALYCTIINRTNMTVLAAT